MSDKHEEHLVEIFGGRKTPGSGNQFNNPMDGRHSRYSTSVAFAWDGKSTRAKSISVTRDMIAKARQQSHGERPMLALRWYLDDRLRTYDDWMLIEEDDLLELMERSERLAAIKDNGCLLGDHMCVASPICSNCGISAYDLPGAEE